MITPCNAQTYSKSPRYFTKNILLESGDGAYVRDSEGNEYIDFACGLGAVTIGYNDKLTNNAIIGQLEKGISFSLPTELEYELCEKLCSIWDMESCRLMKNGSDVTTAAIRMARTITGNDRILKSGYHGWSEWTIGANDNSVGIPDSIKSMTQSIEYNSLEELEYWLSLGGIACFILEPIQGNGANQGYLQGVRDLCDKYQCVLIYDEVVSGFRYAQGGAYEVYGIKPDIVCVGKGMANGMPISAVMSDMGTMKTIEDGCFISTTFGGETLSIVAALSVIDRIDHKHINKMGTRYLKALGSLRKKYEFFELYGLPARCGLEFKDVEGYDYLDLQSMFIDELLKNGIITHPISYFMNSHNKDDVDYLIKIATKGLRRIHETVTKGLPIACRKLNPIFKRG